ncbi:DUF5703 domain-containing protein [uncultured Prevotella sp.]|uniref:DUF5703 domain-containing protein n=1 Tax=uncultured Prevotella sp. TaxID=159272 RepID=UPI0028052C4F|nr:DUF5703 domain-containing protein [uncultured Prevotella sp.]
MNITTDRIFTRAIAASCGLLAYTSMYAGKTVADYKPKDYVWTTQSQNSSGSMPCGGHDVGMNVWVENGDILFYVSKSGMLDENNTLLKAGRFRLNIKGQPFSGTDFEQRLCLDDGAIYIKGKGISIRLWADVYQPKVFVEMNATHKADATLSYESWRYKDRPVTKAECQQGSYKWNIPADCTTFADSIKAAKSSIDFWHTNRSYTVFDYTVSREGLDAIKDELYNPIGGKTFGGSITMPGFKFTGTSTGTYASTDYKAWHYSATSIRQATVSIDLYTGETASTALSAKKSKAQSTKWWHRFWQRSFITAEGEGATMARNYELFRYMLGCNAYGEYPTKFNGSLFTFDPVYADPKCPFTPDFRKWGGGTMTAQNQRLVYWPMLKSGDTDMMKAQFDTYLRMLPNATRRTKFYWNHDGASFSEQIENCGLPNPTEYGKHKPGDDPGMDRNAWLEYQWDTALEFCSMIMQAHKYSGMDIAEYEPLIRQTLIFFDEHYQYIAKKLGVKPLNADGKLMLYPSSGCETYKMAYNPSSVIAALKTVAEQWIEYKGDSLNNFLSRIPPIPLRTIEGDTCIAPAIVWARIQNIETPQLYPVFPWRVYGMGRDNLHIARNTYLKDPHAVEMHSTKGWKQDNIWAACLGLTDEAFRLNREKLADGPYRFPAFWDPGYDWAPDCNKGGASMIGLQEMLLQEKPDGGLLLFPTWPKNINAKFRLKATGGRTVEAEIKNGTIIENE